MNHSHYQSTGPSRLHDTEMIEEEKHEECEDNEYETPPKLKVDRQQKPTINRIKVRNNSVSNPELTGTLV